MRRRALLLLALVASLGLATRPADAQSVGYGIRLWFDNTSDTVFAAMSGDSVEVGVYTYDYYGHGIASFDLTLHFDPARVEYLRARGVCPDTATYPLTATPFASGAGVRLQASGCYAAGATYGLTVARVWLKLKSTAVDGSLLYVRAAAMTDHAGNNRLYDGVDGVEDFCHATGAWGDIDGDRKVNSRDALIALTAAVGLPTTGFDLTRGDVDYDGAVSSRDALYMLTASIGGYLGGSRTGLPAVDACATDVGIARRLYFVRGNTSPGAVAYGSGLAYRASGDTAYTLVGDSADANGPYTWRPRVSPDGASILFVCYANPGQGYRTLNICRADADGGNVQYLTQGYDDYSPDWSPAGDTIVFVRYGQIYRMPATGGTPTLLPGSPGNVTSVAWHQVAGSRRIAYTQSYPSQVVAWRSVDSTSSDTVLATLPSGSADLRGIEWSPNADSLAFDLRFNRYPWNTRVTWVMAAAQGATPQPRFGLSTGPYSTTAPAWTDLGQLFGFYDEEVYRYRLFFVRADGAPFRLMRRDVRDHYLPGMKRQ